MTKTLIAIYILSLGTLAHAAPAERVILKNTDGFNLAKLLLREEVRDCLDKADFKGFDSLSSVDDIRVTWSADNTSTTYVFPVTQYRTEPDDSVRVEFTARFIITEKHLGPRRGGGDAVAVTCELK